MKQHPLFHRMSWRLLGDLVTLEGLSVALDGHTHQDIDFAVLVVLEGTLIVSIPGPRNTPLDTPLPPTMPPAVVESVELVPRVYLRVDPILPKAASELRVEAPRDQVLRFYALTRTRYVALPAQVLAGLEPSALPSGELEDLL